MRIIALLLLLTSIGCSSTYYAALEKIGLPKRDLFVKRIKAAQDSQLEAKDEFKNALEKFSAVLSFEGGTLQAKYDDLSSALKSSEAKAEDVHSRIDSVEDVSDALFEEWTNELGQYKNETLRAESKRKRDDTKAQYETMLKAMRRAESKLEPVLQPLRDQVLFLKHNLNARAISSLDGELHTIESNVDNLVRDLERSIAEADAFIAQMD